MKNKMCSPIHRPEVFKRSNLYRRYCLCNSLPQNWDLSNMAYGLFQSYEREFLTDEINKNGPDSNKL